MGKERKPAVEADHGNDRQGAPAVHSGYVPGKARAFCHWLLYGRCPGTHTIHPLIERTVVAWTSLRATLAMREKYCPARICQILRLHSCRGEFLLNATAT